LGFERLMEDVDERWPGGGGGLNHGGRSASHAPHMRCAIGFISVQTSQVQEFSSWGRRAGGGVGFLRGIGAFCALGLCFEPGSFSVVGVSVDGCSFNLRSIWSCSSRSFRISAGGWTSNGGRAVFAGG